MQRRTFLTAAVAAPTLSDVVSGTPVNVNPFVVKAGEARFGEKTKLFGTSPNDIKVSAKDTNGT